MSIKVVSNTLVLKKPVKAITIDELIHHYALSNQADGKSPKTISWYTDMLSQFSAYLQSKQYPSTLSSFNKDIVKEYVLYLRQKKKFSGHPYTPEQMITLSPRTVQCHVRVLKAFSSWLFVEHYTNGNRLLNQKLPKAPIESVEPLRPEEIQQVASSIDKNSPTGIRNHAIFMMDLDNGLRASELTGIELGNVNLKEGYIKVMGKGAKERIVPIGKFVQATLWHYINHARPKPINPECDRLFLSQDGKPITVNTIKLIFSRLAKHSGVKRLHAHLCRHTFAINYLLNGGDIFSLKTILGHSTLAMVSHYLHFTSSQLTAQHHKYSPMDKLQSEIQLINT
jgi:site-specific recombinase XerD